MLPVRDLNPTRPSFRPYVNYLLIAVNVGIWLLQLSWLGAGVTWAIPAYGVVPVRLLADPMGEAFTVFSSMFMHGSWAHLGGNLLMLHIFGDNVEDAVGHGRYALFYLASGLAAALAQVFVDPTSSVPMVGASGAIAGVLGGYMVLYPRAPVTVLNPIPLLWFVFGIFLVFPAWLVVGEWFVWNLLSGVGSLRVEGQGGVAFFAHIGGFVAGLVLIRPVMFGRIKGAERRWDGWRPPPNVGRGGPGAGPGSWHERYGSARDRWR